MSKGHAEDIQARVDDWWQILLLIAPYVIIVAGTGRAIWMIRWPSREFEDPVYSGAFAFASAFTWWAVRSMEAEGHARTGPVILTAFLACWAIFMAESRQPIREKSQYLLTSVFSGCMVSLLITAMVFIPAFEATKKGKNAMAEYLEQTSNVGPIWLVICSFATYAGKGIGRIRMPFRYQIRMKKHQCKMGRPSAHPHLKETRFRIRTAKRCTSVALGVLERIRNSQGEH